LTTNADIVRRAMRQMGVLAAGQEPEGADASDAMERLSGLITGLPGLTLNARWRERATSAAYTARESDRITVTAPGAVTLPVTVSDPACGSRPPRDLARVQIIGGANAGLWIYIAGKGAWVKVDALSLNDDFPFGKEDEEGIAAQLAVDFASEFAESATVNDRTLAKAQISARTFRARFMRTQPHDWTRPDDSFSGPHHNLPSDCDYF
jgi:hypothetical protein